MEEKKAILLLATASDPPFSALKGEQRREKKWRMSNGQAMAIVCAKHSLSQPLGGQQMLYYLYREQQRG